MIRPKIEAARDQLLEVLAEMDLPPQVEFDGPAEVAAGTIAYNLTIASAGGEYAFLDGDPCALNGVLAVPTGVAGTRVHKLIVFGAGGPTVKEHTVTIQ